MEVDLRFVQVRKELDSLGYYQSLSFESVPLVQKLLGDLKTTTTSLQKYMKIAQNAVKDKENIELNAELYRSNNAKLERECNDLQLSYSNYRSHTDRTLRDLTNKVLILKEENSKQAIENEELTTELRESKLDLMKAGIPSRNNAHGAKKGNVPRIQKKDLVPEDLLRENIEIKRELNDLRKELKDLQCKCHQLGSIADDISLEVEQDGEEPRGKTIDYKFSEDKILRLQKEVHNLTKERNDLEKNYKDALSKQHEAMKRAIHLAERNRELEKELRDIDQMAIAVEEECNDAVKDKSQKLGKLEMALRDALSEVQTLERTIVGMKKEKQELELNNDILRTEKKRLQGILEDVVKEKSALKEKLNNFKIIENDLNLEVDRLARESASQKRLIAEIESKLVSAQIGKASIYSLAQAGVGYDSSKLLSHTIKNGKDRTDQKERSSSLIQPKEPSSRCSHSKTPAVSCTTQTRCCMDKKTITDAFRCGCCEAMCLGHFEELLKKEIDQCQNEIEQTLQQVTQERDHYMEGYNKLLNEMSQLQSKSVGTQVEGCTTCPRIQELVKFLQKENKMLSQEKVTLISRLERTRDDYEIIGKCNKSSCKRVQREKDLFKADVARLEEECDCLRDNVKALCEAKNREHDTFTQQIHDYEQRLKKMESERSELMCTQGTRRAQVNSLEDKNELMKRMLRTNQDDLQNQKILYSQLKTLHDQTDKALMDTQGQLVQVEKELSTALQTIEELSNKSKNHDCRCAEIDLDTMKRQLNRLDQEKDELLNIADTKTEEVDKLKKNLESKINIIESLKIENNDLKSRFGDLTDRATSRSVFLHEAEGEVARLQKLLDSATKSRDNALEINRKLQEELALITREANSLKSQLAHSQEKIENLKSQSQQYITEVKRAKDLLDNREKEREDLLNQFQQLCKETNHLQSSNSALESEASQSKVQLSVAMDHVNSLEQKGETLETLVSDYEKQIGLLTNQIAKFESERNQHRIYEGRSEAELKTMRELCMRLDKEKEQLRMQLLNKDAACGRIDELQRKNEALSVKLSECTTKLSNAEKLLNEARQDGVELKLKDEDTFNEIRFLKNKIAELEQRLASASRDVDMYQEKALDYSNQIRQLRRQLTNERYHKSSRGEEDRYPSL